MCLIWGSDPGTVCKELLTLHGPQSSSVNGYDHVHLKAALVYIEFLR